VINVPELIDQKGIQMKINTEDCNKCNGRGYILEKNREMNIILRCKKCKGFGKLDWIEQIFGISWETGVPKFEIIWNRYYEDINKGDKNEKSIT
jgi:ribosomal protein L33